MSNRSEDSKDEKRRRGKYYRDYCALFRIDVDWNITVMNAVWVSHYRFFLSR